MMVEIWELEYCMTYKEKAKTIWAREGRRGGWIEESERSFGVGAEEKEEEEDREQMAVAPVSSAQQTGAARWREHSQESAAFWENMRRLAGSFGFNNCLKKKVELIRVRDMQTQSSGWSMNMHVRVSCSHSCFWSDIFTGWRQMIMQRHWETQKFPVKVKP